MKARSIVAGAPPWWAKLRSPLGSMRTAVVLVATVLLASSAAVAIPSPASVARITSPHTSVPTRLDAATFIPSRAIAVPVLQTIPPVVTRIGST